MTSEREPPRLRTLTGQLPEQLLAALQDAPEDAPTSAELSALAQRFRARFEPPAPRASHPSPVARGPLVAAAVMFAFGAAAGVLASGAVFLALRSTSVPAPSAAPSPSSARLAAVPPPPGAPAMSTSTTPASEQDGPAPRAPRAPAPSTSGDAPVSAGGVPAASGDELALLARAQAALASDPAAALALADDHGASFAHGALAQEREVVAIDALLRLGRRGEALGRAERFRRRFPGSVHARRIEVLLAKVNPARGVHN